MSEETKKEETQVTVSSELHQEIEGAVTDVVEQTELEREERNKQIELEAKPDTATKESTTLKGESKGEKPDKDDRQEEPEKDAVTDEDLERAIKAGMSMVQAKKFTSKEDLTSMVNLLESKKPDTDDNNAGSDTDGKGDDDDPLNSIPDLDPEDYDEKIVAGFKAMKDIIKKQNDVIAKLRSGNTGGDAIADRLQKLGTEYADAAPAGSGERAELEKKLKILKAGYKAAGEDVAEDDIFAEAAKMVLGDVVDESRSVRKADEVAKRKKLHLSRPSGTSIKPKGDVFEDVAKEIDAEFGKS